MHEDKVNLEDIVFRGVTLSIKKPDNIVKTDSDHIIQMTRIRKEQNIVFLYGYIFKDVADVFQYPCASSKVGIMKLGRLSETEKKFSLDNIIKKCVFLRMTVIVLPSLIFMINKIKNNFNPNCNIFLIF